MSRFFSILIISLIALLQCNCGASEYTGVISKGVIGELCYNLQKYEVLFTNRCHLQADNLEPQFDWFFEFIRKYKRDNSIDELLTYFFKNSTIYFQAQYPQFKPDYQKFETSALKLYATMKKRTANTTVQEFIDIAKIMTNAYNSIVANPDKTCVTDETICPVLEAMFGIDVVTPFNVAIPKFLTNIKDNMIKFMKVRHNNELKFEDALITTLTDYLGEQGTAGTNVKKIRQLALSDFYKYLRMLNEYTPEVTKKPIVTNAVVKKTTKIAVTSAVYLSVPLVLLAAGFIVCILIVVLVYRMKPNKGGSQEKTKPADPTEKL